MLASLFLTLAALPAILASPIASSDANSVEARASCVDHCGNVCYWQSDITAALNKGYSLYQEGQTEGTDKYPHEYYDDEGFNFAVSGSYQEFPILSSFKVYSGGSPGADRVVFNTNGQFAGLITHTGASGNNFKQCTKN